MLYGAEQLNLNPEAPHLPQPNPQKEKDFHFSSLKFSLKNSLASNHTSFCDQSVTYWELRVATFVVAFKREDRGKGLFPLENKRC